MKHIFIINPAAGKGRSLELIPFIQKCFEDKPEHCIIRVTEYPGHATEIAREYCSVEICRVYSVGGDGTVNEIVNGMAGSDSSLGVIPTGSGNDFLRSIQPEYEIKEMIRQIIAAEDKYIDLARVNDKYFINISSIGFDAQVVFNAKKFKRIPLIPGRLAYLFSILYTVFQKRVYNITMDIDGKRQNRTILLAAVANGRYYGGGMLPAPEAQLNDGLLDVCLVEQVSRVKILSFFPKYINGTHGEMREVSFHRGRKITVESDKNICLNIDGEIFIEKIIEFEIIKDGIRIIFPGKEV